MQITVAAATEKNIFIASNGRHVHYKRAHNTVELCTPEHNKSCSVERHSGIVENVLSDITAFSADRSAMVYVYKDQETNQQALGQVIFNEEGMRFSSFALNGLDPKAVAVSNGGKRVVISFNENADEVRLLGIEDADTDARFAEQKIGPYYEALCFNGPDYFLGIQTKDDGTNPLGFDVYSFNTLTVGSLTEVAKKAITKQFGDNTTVQMTPHICAATTNSLFFVHTTSGVLSFSLEEIDGKPQVAVSHVLPMAISSDAICLGIFCSSEGHYVGQINQYPATEGCGLTHEVFVRARHNQLCWTNTLACAGIDATIDTSDNNPKGVLVTELI